MNTENLNWKSLGWLITRKLVYYALVVLAAVFLFMNAAALMSMASSLSVVIGVVLTVVTIGSLATIGIREALFYFKLFNS